MGFKILFLTILLILVWITGPSFYRARTGCIQCHPTVHLHHHHHHHYKQYKYNCRKADLKAVIRRPLAKKGNSDCEKKSSKFLIKQCRYEKSGRCIKCHRGNPLSNRKNIAHSQLIPGRYALFTIPGNSIVKIGYELIQEMACRRCHTINHKGSFLASNLDFSYKTTQPEILFHAIQSPSVFMPKFYFSQKNIKILVNTILASGTNNDFQLKNSFETVHFETKNHKTDRTNIFNIHCGSCHRIITKEYGPLGKGDIGPNLSGLFSKFFFKTRTTHSPSVTATDKNSQKKIKISAELKDSVLIKEKSNIQGKIEGKIEEMSRKEKIWNDNKLKLWLNNPRNIRPATEMQPVKLSNREFTGILNLLDKTHCIK